MKVDKEKEVLRDQLADVQKRVGKGEAEEARFKAEVFTLNMIINEADTERLKQQKEYETVLSERDVLGTQLIKRVDELGGLYEKIKVQQSTLNAGQRAYAERGRGHPGAPRRHRRAALRARRAQGERAEHRPAAPRGAPAQPRGAPRAHEGARCRRSSTSR